MKKRREDLSRYTLRLNRDLLYKLHYIAAYQGRSVNGQILYLIRCCVADFEAREEKILPPISEREQS